ncbi:hypothetical protein CDAR_405111 [Caerostris darwini]|uniref:Uncharacterized protein n=1 Tax=Caerostris darwini TaxID=1538125 RepID=A0AAV4U6U6_9ARAC|nr:hypothetical protein CDAR_405111 [Caerostris darwini]
MNLSHSQKEVNEQEPQKSITKKLLFSWQQLNPERGKSTAYNLVLHHSSLLPLVCLPLSRTPGISVRAKSTASLTLRCARYFERWDSDNTETRYLPQQQTTQM